MQKSVVAPARFAYRRAGQGWAEGGRAVLAVDLLQALSAGLLVAAPMR